MPFNKQRELRPSIFLDERFLDLTTLTRLLLLQLGWWADDEGRGQVNTGVMKGVMFSLSADVTPKAIEDSLWELDEALLIEIYGAGKKSFFQIIPWELWWKTDKPARSLFPARPPADEDGRDDVATPSRPLREPVAIVEGEGEREHEGESAARESPRAGAASRLHLDQSGAPYPFCAVHAATFGTDRPCRACGRQRLAHEAHSRQLEFDGPAAAEEP